MELIFLAHQLRKAEGEREDLVLRRRHPLRGRTGRQWLFKTFSQNGNHKQNLMPYIFISVLIETHNGGNFFYPFVSFYECKIVKKKLFNFKRLVSTYFLFWIFSTVPTLNIRVTVGTFVKYK